MKLIQQPNNWTCAAACVCMITGTTLEDFYAFCGHDGSEPVEVTLARWMGIRCFDMKELIRYLLTHDMFLGCGSTLSHDFDPLKEVSVIEFDWEKQDILVDVASGYAGKGVHQILWSHRLKRIIDPRCPGETRELKDYKVVGYWPVVKMSGAAS